MRVPLCLRKRQAAASAYATFAAGRNAHAENVKIENEPNIYTESARQQKRTQNIMDVRAQRG